VSIRDPDNAADSTEPRASWGEVNSLVDQAVKTAPEMLQAQANLRAAEHGVSAAKKNDAPVLSGSRGQRAGQCISAAQRFGDYWSELFLESLRWIHDRREGEGSPSETSNRLRASLESVRLGVISDVSQAYLNLLTPSSESHANAEVVTRRRERGLRVGRRCPLRSGTHRPDAKAESLSAFTTSAFAVSIAARCEKIQVGLRYVGMTPSRTDSSEARADSTVRSGFLPFRRSGFHRRDSRRESLQ